MFVRHKLFYSMVVLISVQKPGTLLASMRCQTSMRIVSFCFICDQLAKAFLILLLRMLCLSPMHDCRKQLEISQSTQIFQSP